jgi:hypothetical protein
MRTISLHQPWASLCVSIDPISGRAAKENETRHWAPDLKPGTDLVIHAAKKWSNDVTALVANGHFNAALHRLCLAPIDPRWWDRISSCYTDDYVPLPLGALVGVVTFVRWEHTEAMRDSLTDQERAFGNWSDGRYAWAFGEPRRFATPIPWKGHQGFFNVPDDVVRAARKHGA